MFITGIDIDSTLSSASCQISLYNKVSGKHLEYEDITDYHIEEVCEMDNVYEVIMTEYIEEYFDNVDIRPNAIDVINKLIELKLISPYIITARSDTDYIRYRTEIYLQDNNLMLIPLHMLSSHNKLATALKLGLDIMLEDHPDTSLSLAENGIKVLLFDTPYNRNVEHENIIRVKDFLDVFRVVLHLEGLI